MKFDFKGIQRNNTSIQPLIDVLENVNDFQTWEYMGLQVEIDPTIDYNNQNVLVRWLDNEEGFNDKIIVHSLKEFNSHFQAIN